MQDPEAEALIRRGALLRADGDVEEAEATYRAALRRATRCPPRSQELAQLREKRRAAEAEARETFDERVEHAAAAGMRQEARYLWATSLRSTSHLDLRTKLRGSVMPSAQMPVEFLNRTPL